MSQKSFLREAALFTTKTEAWNQRFCNIFRREFFPLPFSGSNLLRVAALGYWLNLKITYSLWLLGPNISPIFSWWDSYFSMQKAEKAAARQGVIALLYYTRYFWDEDWLAGTRVETKRGIRVSREKRYLVTLWLALCLQPLLQLYCFIRTFFTMHNMFSGFTN